MRQTLNIKLAAIVIGVLLVAGVGVHFLHGFQLQRNAYRLLDLADQAVKDGKDEKALAYYEQYLNLAPEDVDTVQKYALVLDRRDDTDPVKLILCMEQVLRVKPNEQTLRLRLVHNLIALDRFAAALDNLRRLEKTTPDKADVLHMIGWCQEAMKDYRAAAKSFQEAIRINPKQTRSYVLLAEVYEDRLNQPDEAQQIIDELVQANPDAYQAYLLRARLLRRHGDDKSAQADLQTAYKLAPAQPEVILELADAARTSGDWEEATRLLKDGMNRFPDQSAFYQGLAWLKVQSKDNAGAIQHLKDGLRRVPASNELAVLLIDLMIDQKQYQEARAGIDDLLKAGWSPTLPNYLKARLAVADKHWNEAITLLQGVRKDLGETSEWHGRVYALLGLCYRHLGDREQELQAFRKAVQHEPNWLVANLGLATAYLDNGRVEEASQTLEPLRTVEGLPAEYWTLQRRLQLYRNLRGP